MASFALKKAVRKQEELAEADDDDSRFEQSQSAMEIYRTKSQREMQEGYSPIPP